MKIYNEITTIFNDITGKWETISEDSYEYNGSVALMAEGASLPANAHALSDDEKIVETLKVTAGYFTNGDGTLEGVNIHTGSLADSNKEYYFNATQAVPTSAAAETQFSVTFGHYAGSGSDSMGDTANLAGLKSETQAIYKQFSNLLLDPAEAKNGFIISSPSTDSAVASGKDEYIYVLIGKRNRFKDRMNKKAWTLQLSGSTGTATAGAPMLQLTDDSADRAPTTTPAGDRYNIVSGSAGLVKIPSTERTFGHFYPDMGIMLFSGAELSASIPGKEGASGISDTIATWNDSTNNAEYLKTQGFAPNLSHEHPNAQNALKFLTCMQNVGTDTNFRLRSEEDQTQINYFCRIKPKEANFSNNPTFVSGSKNKIRNTDMIGNPQTFISGIGLYNAMGQLVAVARLSSPLKKNFASEATIKVKLTY